MHINRSRLIILAFAVLLAFIIRIIPVIKDSVHFSFDQGLDIIMVKQLVVDHKVNLISRYSGLQGVLMGPVWTWFLAIPFFLSGGDPAANVVWLALFSVISSVATYFVVRRILGRTIATFTFLATLFAPFFITNSQIVLSPHPLTYLYIFFIWFVFEVFVKGRILFWVPLLVLSGLFFQFEIAFAIFSVLSVVVMALFDLAHFRKLLLNKYFFIGIFSFIITFLPQVLFDLRHNFLISQSLVGFFTGQNNSLYTTTPPLLVRFLERVNSFSQDFANMTVSSSSVLILLPTIIIAASGWWSIFRQKEKTYSQLFRILIIILLTFFVAFSLYPGAIWGWYRQGLPIIYILLLTIPFGYLFGKSRFSRIPVSLFSVALLAYFINPGQIIKTLFQTNTSVGGLGEQKQILDYVYGSAGGQKFSYFAYTPPVYDYIWQYDFFWYGQKTYGYLPNNWQMGVPLLGVGTQTPPPQKGIGLFYLIVEPDIERPWAPNGWRESFIKIGKTEETKHFPSKIVVEKRNI